MEHVELSTICNALEERMHYGEAGIAPAEALEVLFFGWKKQQARLYKRSTPVFDTMWRRGWLQGHEARSFCEYCITGWRPKFLKWP